MKKKVAPGSRVPLTRELVLRTALEIMDESGIEALSMRLLGKRLGVEAMSLYNHAANKDDILDGAVDLVIGEITIPSADTGWRTAMKERAVSARDAFKRHPWASALIDSRMSSSQKRLRYFDTIIGTLQRAGFSPEQALRVFSVLDSYVYGFGRQRLNMAAADGEKENDKQAAEFRKIIPDHSYPYLAGITELMMKSGYDEDADFEFGLGIILDGLEKLL